MINSTVVPVVIALLLMAAGALGVPLSERGTGLGIWLYAAVAIVAITLSRAWLTQRLLTQLAALVCLLLAQYLSPYVSQTLAVAGVLLFIHTLILARVPRLFKPRQ
ncbi:MULTISPECIES: hypothetical protein [unclassified Pseudomonas]|uniref:hypothetical protein n=1 Tax=unclassified Pseudomonas TaxID=196821 RepID=UPI0015A23924|nr:MULTISPECIES: hypothetical protein [unclassified Pseudomonas]NVZ17575.1 hypothetical protein [Pseudomonas sp. IPO3775]NWA80381.1 hypothetical protein [Pseudomonas sp. C8002]